MTSPYRSMLNYKRPHIHKSDRYPDKWCLDYAKVECPTYYDTEEEAIEALKRRQEEDKNE